MFTLKNFCSFKSNAKVKKKVFGGQSERGERGEGGGRVSVSLCIPNRNEKAVFIAAIVIIAVVIVIVLIIPHRFHLHCRHYYHQQSGR